MRTALRTGFCVAVAFVMCATAAFGQDAARGQLTVVVTDAMNARIAGATVTVSRGTERQTATAGADGVARLANLGTGMWTVTIASPGFSRWQQPIMIGAGSIDVSASLVVEGLTETVEVVSEAAEPTQIPLNALASGGTRLELAVRDLPASLFMVGQQLIQDRGARSVEEAVQLAVGMIASTGVGSIPSYQTRGWASSNVAVMRDGIRQNTASQSSRPVDAFILDRIEILKGPASLLYGEGSIGGAVNMVSKSPMSELNVSTLLSYGSFGSYRAGAGVNVPLRRNLFARVDLSRTGTDGYVKNSPQQLNAAAASLR